MSIYTEPGERALQYCADGSRAHVHLWFAMLYILKCRQQYREERQISDELGFDVVDLGGES